MRLTEEKVWGRDDVATWASPSADSVSVTSTDADSGEVPLGNLWRFCAALYAFSRPHTVAGTTVSIISISLVALQVTPDCDEAIVVRVVLMVGDGSHFSSPEGDRDVAVGRSVDECVHCWTESSF